MKYTKDNVVGLAFACRNQADKNVAPEYRVEMSEAHSGLTMLRGIGKNTSNLDSYSSQIVADQLNSGKWSVVEEPSKDILTFDQLEEGELYITLGHQKTVNVGYGHIFRKVGSCESTDWVTMNNISDCKGNLNSQSNPVMKNYRRATTEECLQYHLLGVKQPSETPLYPIY